MCGPGVSTSYLLRCGVLLEMDKEAETTTAAEEDLFASFRPQR